MDRGISRPHVLIGAAALVCVLAVPLATSWGDTQATESAGVSKKRFKKLKQQVNDLQAQVDQLAKQPGPQGQQGLPGTPGQDATNLFAYIRDPGGGATESATVDYGSGVTAVSEVGLGYMVTFNRSVVNCVVNVLQGFGDPIGVPAAGEVSFPSVNMSLGNATEVPVFLYNHTGTPVDASFMITAFC